MTILYISLLIWLFFGVSNLYICVKKEPPNWMTFWLMYFYIIFIVLGEMLYG